MREQHGIKELQVVERFTGPEETDRHGDGAAQGDNATTLRRAIQLRDHEARERHRGRKHFRLPNGVLSHAGVEDEQRLMRRAPPGPPLRHDAHDLLELFTQPFIGMEPACRIDEYGVHTPRRRRLEGVERDRRGIASLRCAHEWRAEAIGPYPELLGGTRARCVGGREQHAAAFPLQAPRELCDRRRFARAVDAENQDHRRRRWSTCEGCGRGTELLDDDTLQARLIDRVGVTQPFHGLVGRRDAEIRFDQQALHGFELDGVRRAAGEEATDLLPEPHYGSPWRRRSAHSVASAAIAITNSHQRSRRPTEPTRAVASPGWALNTGARGSHSSEYVSTATTPRSMPPLNA